MKNKTRHQLANWLYIGAFSIFIQIILGGITRLTGSGLSITEWQPLLGVLPPANTANWQHSFEQYQRIAQFKLVNSHFNLSDYKSIFFWEWLHRNWARTIGLIFIIPFILFVFTKKINRKMFIQLSILFGLGLLQAVIGWIMVKSGLNDTTVAVNDIKLAIHFITAVILLCYTLWIAFKLSITTKYPTTSTRINTITSVTFCLLLLQMFYGALMAGSHAALSAPTWPDMNGHLIPPELLSFKYETGNTYLLTIQFVHRIVAYIILVLIFLLYKRTISWKTKLLLSRIRIVPIILVIIQLLLGITTLLNSMNPCYRIFALLHQCTGLLLLSSILLLFYISHTNLPFKKIDHQKI